MFMTGRAPVEHPEDAEQRAGLFRRMRDSLGKSRRAMTQQLSAVVFNPADTEVWERLEEALILADCGVPATVTMIERLEAEADAGSLRTADDLSRRLTEIVAEMMTPAADPRIDVSHKPSVLLVSGVNGSGKTTTVGKLSPGVFASAGRRVRDRGGGHRSGRPPSTSSTVWAERVGAQLVRQAQGADPARRGLRRGRRRPGPRRGRRPHRHRRPAPDPAQPDGGAAQGARGGRQARSRARPTRSCWCSTPTTGQNGLSQARLFHEAVGVTGVVLTKVDGTARGGIAVAIAARAGHPGEARRDRARSSRTCSRSTPGVRARDLPTVGRD